MHSHTRQIYLCCMGNNLLHLKCDWSWTSPCITGPTVVPQYYGVAAAPWGVYPANIIQQGAAAAAQQRRPLTPSSASEISNSSTNLTQVCTLFCIQAVWLLVMLLVAASREYFMYHIHVIFSTHDSLSCNWNLWFREPNSKFYIGFVWELKFTSLKVNDYSECSQLENATVMCSSNCNDLSFGQSVLLV